MYNEYFNEQVDLEKIAKIEEVDFIPLEKDYLKVLILFRIISLSILSLLIAVFIFLNPFDFPAIIIQIFILVYSIYVIWIFVSTLKGFRHKAYALRAKDIIYKKGWLWRSVTTAPFNRVQHVQIDQGPIERQFNLSRLKIFTAGGASSDLTIPGINPDNAKAIKEFIVKRTADEEE